MLLRNQIHKIGKNKICITIEIIGLLLALTACATKHVSDTNQITKEQTEETTEFNIIESNRAETISEPTKMIFLSDGPMPVLLADFFTSGYNTKNLTYSYIDNLSIEEMKETAEQNQWYINGVFCQPDNLSSILEEFSANAVIKLSVYNLFFVDTGTSTQTDMQLANTKFCQFLIENGGQAETSAEAEYSTIATMQ